MVNVFHTRTKMDNMTADVSPCFLMTVLFSVIHGDLSSTMMVGAVALLPDLFSILRLC